MEMSMGCATRKNSYRPNASCPHKLLSWRCSTSNGCTVLYSSSDIIHICLGTELSTSLPSAVLVKPTPAVHSSLQPAAQQVLAPPGQGQPGSFQASSTSSSTVTVTTSLQGALFITQQDVAAAKASPSVITAGQRPGPLSHQFSLHHPSFHPRGHFTCTLSDTLWLRGRITGDHSFSAIPMTLPGSQ